MLNVRNRLDIVGHLLIRKSTLAPAQWKKILRAKEKKREKGKKEKKTKEKSFADIFEEKIKISSY
jgi:hypothetical protein